MIIGCHMLELYIKKKTYKLYDYSNFWGFLGQNLNFGAGQLKKI